MHRPTAEFPQHLETLYRRFPFERSLALDPLSCVRPFAGSTRGAEVAGIFAATIAIGNVTSIRHAFATLLERADGNLEAAVERAGPSGRRIFAPFRHRWIRDDQMDHLARQLAHLYGSYSSLEELFEESRQANGFPYGLDALARGLRGNGDRDGPSAPPGYARLFPSPLDPSGSACKRLTLFLRWMVRRGFPDLGVWTHTPTEELRIPLDQHVYWIAYHLGLTGRRTRNWKTVEEVTAALRAIDPTDPVKYDFVLCHTGISGDCPKRRDMRVCGPCSVRPDCLLWRRVRGGS
ncbi:MAG TPA: DUF2400 family protein [Thermoplasmata archaeon]|nr:DUF2400 family protein [Thermoplasmata archaeon]